MHLLWNGFCDAIRLMIHLDSQVVDAAVRSLWISSLAVLMAAALGLPMGTWLACTRFPGRWLVVLGFRAAMALPTVFVGILGYALLSRRGLLGPWELLYTPWAILGGEIVLALPIVISICHGAVKALDPRVAETAWILGAKRLRRGLTYLSEARVGVMLAVLTAFSRCVTELGIAMMVGGNLKERTRTLATATALETGKGEFARGLAMGLILLAIATGVTMVIVTLSQEEP